MLTRKRKSQPIMDRRNRKKKGGDIEIILEDAPQIRCLADLIVLSNSLKFYKNIDMVMLWRITPYLESLNNMIGMEKLKQSIFYQIIYYLQGMHSQNLNGEYLHTVIYGSPGCGKTTVAKIIGKIYQTLNILSSSGPFKIAYRDDFIAGYLGQTAAKTKKLLNSCLGGVLFIDEVYSLAPRDTDKDSFSKEAVDTITGFLSENKNNFCCIIAGYENEIENCFFGMNEGLKRRFPWVHRIEEYTSFELYQIFLKLINEENWKIACQKEFIINMFDKNKKYFQFAGGSIETFITKCKMTHSLRVFGLEKEVKFILTEQDIINGLDLIIKNEKVIQEDKPPEHMYI